MDVETLRERLTHAQEHLAPLFGLEDRVEFEVKTVTSKPTEVTLGYEEFTYVTGPEEFVDVVAKYKGRTLYNERLPDTEYPETPSDIAHIVGLALHNAVNPEFEKQLKKKNRDWFKGRTTLSADEWQKQGYEATMYSTVRGLVQDLCTLSYQEFLEYLP